ncbi:hypothetical protein PIB30_098113, partial [Stylosanthes scabra]|nr:hypothetical protein [Stylosanthes scabra]
EIMNKQRKKKKIENKRNLSQVTKSPSSSKASQIHTQVTFRLGACQVPNVTHPYTKEASTKLPRPHMSHVWVKCALDPNVTFQGSPKLSQACQQGTKITFGLGAHLTQT